MALTGNQFAQLHAALLSAFPAYGDLEMMVQVGLSENLNAIAGGGSLNNVVFELIRWAEATGKLSLLVTQAHEAVPGNALLRQFAASLGLASS